MEDLQFGPDELAALNAGANVLHANGWKADAQRLRDLATTYGPRRTCTATLAIFDGRVQCKGVSGHAGSHYVWNLAQNCSIMWPQGWMSWIS